MCCRDRVSSVVTFVTAAVFDNQMTTRNFDGRDLPWATTTGTGTAARMTVSEFDGNGNPRRESLVPVRAMVVSPHIG